MAAPPLPPRYRAVSMLGEGGMGEVWRVVDTLASGDVPPDQALKIIRAELRAGAARSRPGRRGGAEASFESEFRILAGLRHPNLARVFDFGQLPDRRLYYTSELVRGRPLSQLVGTIEIGDACRVLAALCRVLDFLGSRGLVHNDVK